MDLPSQGITNRSAKEEDHERLPSEGKASSKPQTTSRQCADKRAVPERHFTLAERNEENRNIMYAE
jgi:hypothetical protein